MQFNRRKLFGIIAAALAAPKAAYVRRNIRIAANIPQFTIAPASNAPLVALLEKLKAHRAERPVVPWDEDDYKPIFRSHVTFTKES